MSQDLPLWDRRVDVTIDTIEFTTLACTFSITKTLKPEPNTCELTVFNLNEEHQAQLEQLQSKAKGPATKGIPCRIEAGYAEGTSLVWLGDLRRVQTVREGANWVTTLTSGDGEKAWQNARAHISYGPGTDHATAIRAIVRALGVGEGNLSKVIAKLKIAGAAAFPSGATVSGTLSRHLVDIARSANLEVSVQDGDLQFLDAGKADGATALRIATETGMVDSPSVDNKGLLAVRVLMIPGVKCGSLIQMDAARIKGGYRIVKATWSGATDEEDWTIDIEAKRY